MAIFPLPGLAESEVEQTELSISIGVDRSETSSAPSGPISLEVLLRREGTDEERKLPLLAPGKLQTLLPTGTTWRLSSLHREYWFPPRSLAIEAGRDHAALTLRPAGFIELSLSNRSSELPDRVSLNVTSTRASPPETWQADCDVDDLRKIRCMVPAGSFDLRLAADGYVPRYFWAKSTPWKATLRLGSIMLKRGASVMGWVDLPGRELSFAGVEISLKPRSAASLGSESQRRFSASQHTAQADGRGFFQFAAIRPGEYDLIADHPDFVPTRSSVVVTADQELELDPIMLSEGAALDLEIRQKTDPFRQPWLVTLGYRGSERGYLEQKAVGIPAGEDGRLQLSGLPAGQYLLAVEDSRGGRWYAEPLQLFDGENPHRAEISVERLEVTLIYDDEPLEGALVELREHRGNSQQAFRSRKEGKVYAFLRKDRLWNFEITHEALDISASFLEVEVPEIEKGDRHAKKDLVIPATRIFGEVVDSSGAPVLETLHFDMSNEEHGNIQRFADQGTFDFKGLPAGPLRLQVSHDEAGGRTTSQSDWLSVTLEDGVDQGPLIIQMLDTYTLSGLVVSPGGDGVPGAQVVALPEHIGGQRLTASVPKIVTDFEGVFEIDLPARAELVQLTVYPPGFAATQQRIALRRDETSPVIIPVDNVGGTIVLRYENPPSQWLDTPFELTLNTVLFSPYAHVPLYLSRWSEGAQRVRATDFEVVFPMVEPGPVRVCFGPEFVALLATAAPVATSLEDRCFGGDLPPHGELVLEVSEEAIKGITSHHPE